MSDKFNWDEDEFEITPPEARTDWNPDQPRDEKGRFGEGGGANFAKLKEQPAFGSGADSSHMGSEGRIPPGEASKLNAEYAKAFGGNAEFAKVFGGGTSAEQRAIQRAGQEVQNDKFRAAAAAVGYNENEQAAKALAGRDAGVEEYHQQVEANRPGAVAGGRAAFAAEHGGVGPFTMEGRAGEIQLNEQALSAQQAEGHEAPNTLRGQQIMPEQGDKTYQGGLAKELDDRIHEALKNNAKLGDAGIEPARVIAEVHERIAKEKADEVVRQAAVRERLQKEKAVEKERDDKIRVADDKVEKLADERRAAAREAVQANEKFNEARDKYNAAGAHAADAGDMLKLMAARDAADEKANLARAAQNNAIEERNALDPQAPERTSSERNIADLTATTVVSTESLGGGANASSIAFLSDNTKAVYKPVSGERSRLRKTVDGGTYYLREAAASAVAKQLGVEDLVPATVIHDGPQGVGSLQAFVPDSTSLFDGSGNEMFDRDASERMRTFDWITGNSDRHGGNVMIVEKGEHTLPILVDNGLAFPKGQPDRMITPYDHIPHEPMSEKTISLINSIDHVKLASTLAASGIEKEAVRYSIARAVMLRDDPQMLSGESRRTASYDWDDVPEVTHEDLERADKVLSDPAVAAGFEVGAPIYAAVEARKASAKHRGY